MKVGDRVRIINGKSDFYDFVGPIDTIVLGATLPYHVVLSGRIPLGTRVDGPVYFMEDELELVDPPKCPLCGDLGWTSPNYPCDCETGRELLKAMSTRDFLDNAQIVGHVFDGKDDSCG